MYTYMSSFLADRKGGTIFNCFDIWHICFIVFFVGIAIFLPFYLKNKDRAKIKSVIETFINIAVGLYVADFFLMPFAYGQINIDKLPFHVCTTMCVMCFLSRHVGFLKKYKLQFATLGFVSNLVYLFYPAGMMWLEIHPLSYRVVQTLLFHGTMAVYGFLVLIYEREGFEWKKWYRDLIVVTAMSAWALFGNTMYNNDKAFYNWFFVVEDPFSMFPHSISQYIMPFLNIALFFVVELLVHFIFYKATKQAEVKNV